MKMSTAERIIARAWMKNPEREWSFEDLQKASSQSESKVRSFAITLYANCFASRRLEIVGDDYRIYRFLLTAEGLGYFKHMLEAEAEESTDNQLPAYVLLGRWQDPQSDPERGPRNHPYDWRFACLKRVGAEMRIYPSREAADAAT